MQLEFKSELKEWLLFSGGGVKSGIMNEDDKDENEDDAAGVTKCLHVKIELDVVVRRETFRLEKRDAREERAEEAEAMARGWSSEDMVGG